MSRRIHIDLSDAACAEIDRLKAERGLSTADLFLHALSVYRIYPRGLDEIRKFGQSHHQDLPGHALVHALTVDLPAMCDRLERGEAP